MQFIYNVCKEYRGTGCNYTWEELKYRLPEDANGVPNAYLKVVCVETNSRLDAIGDSPE